MRRRVYEILNNVAAGDRLGRLISSGLLLLITANVIADALETDAAIAASAPGFFRAFDVISVIVFTVEYALRLWSAVEDPALAQRRRPRLRSALSPMMLIDLAVIAPFYITLLAPTVIDLRYLRVLRLARVFRLLRLPRVAHSFTTMVRVVHGKRVELVVAILFVVIAMFVSAGVMYTVERNEPNTLFTSIPRSMWWAIVTITTVGYGDMVPQTALGQTVGGLVAFVGICALALPVGILSSGFIEEIGRRQRAAAEPRTCPRCNAPLDHVGE